MEAAFGGNRHGDLDLHAYDESCRAGSVQNLTARAVARLTRELPFGVGDHSAKLARAIAIPALFSLKPAINFVAETAACPDLGSVR
jgi:hypothetical protein